MENQNITNTQRHILLDQIVSGNVIKYNIGGYFKLPQVVELSILAISIANCLNRHEVFSSVINKDNLTELVFGNENQNIEIIERKYTSKELLDKFKADFIVPFYPGKPLYKIIVASDSNKYKYLYIKVHHSIADGLSISILFKQIKLEYDNLVNGLHTNIIIPKYADYVKEEQAYLRSKQYTIDKQYWMNEFNILPDRLFNVQQSRQGSISIDELFIDENNGLITVCKDLNVTVALYLETIIIYIIKIYFNVNNICIGVPIANRNQNYKSTFGAFLTVLPLFVQLTKDSTLLDIIELVKLKHNQILRHRKFQTANIVEELRNKQFNINLYEVRFSFEPFIYPNEFANSEYGIFPLSNNQESDPISIHIRNYNGNHYKVHFEYDKNLVSTHKANSILDSILAILKSSKNIGERQPLDLFSRQQFNKLLKCSWGPKKELGKVSLAETLRSNFARYTNKIAIVEHNTAITYGKLEQYITAYAIALIEFKIIPGDTICVHLKNSIQYIISILSINRIGGIFIPIDIDLPDLRKVEIINDSKCKVIITDEEIHQIIDVKQIKPIDFSKVKPNIQFIDLHINQQNDNVYVLYTSGSTGSPKGVLIRQNSLINYTDYFIKYFNLNCKDKVFQQASIGFDTSIEEIFPALMAGAAIVISKNNKDFPEMLQEIKQQKITLLSTHPHFVNYLNEQNMIEIPSLKTIITGGEKILYKNISNLIHKFQIFNSYGPTEATICASYKKINFEENYISIGKPIQNYGIFILSQQHELLPLNAIGEIAISGAGLANKYWGEHQLTIDKFVNVRINNDEISVYKTGDLGYYNENLELCYLGRKDDQIKIHGQRVDLSEISFRLEQLEEITQSVVKMVNCNGKQLLTAYCISICQDIDLQKVYNYLESFLPSYMIPQYFVFLSKFPINVRGKIDLKLLPIPNASNEYRQKKIFPTSLIERKIFEIWEKILGSNNFGILDNFYALGGHSLLLFKLKYELNCNFNIDFNISDLKLNNTILKQSQFIASQNAQGMNFSIDKNKLNKQSFNFAKLQLLSTQKRLWLEGSRNINNNAYHLFGTIKISGKLDKFKLIESIKRCIRKHIILQACFDLNKDSEIEIKLASKNEIDKYEIKLNRTTAKDLQFDIQKFVDSRFELNKFPLIKFQLNSVEEDENFLTINVHHILCDGWSVELLLSEIINNYHEDDSNLEFQEDYSFLYYMEKEKEYEHGPIKLVDKNYWEAKYKSTFDILKFPKAIKSDVSQVRFKYDNKTINAFIKLLSEKNYSIFTGLVSTIRILFYKYYQLNDILISTVVTNRDEINFYNTIGLCINGMILRNQIDPNEDCWRLIEKESDSINNDLLHKQYPLNNLFDYIYSEHGFENCSNILVVLNNEILIDKLFQTKNSSLTISKFDVDLNLNAQYDIQFMFYQHNYNLELQIIFNNHCFSSKFIERLCLHHQHLIECILSNQFNSIKELEYLSLTERNELLSLNSINHFFAKSNLFLEAVTNISNFSGEKIALYYDQYEFTYSWLTETSNKLSSFLRNEYSVVAGDNICVCLERNEWLIVSILSIFKCGAVYVPIDLNYPDERKSFIMEDVRAKIVINKNIIKEYLNIEMKYNSNTSFHIPANNDIAYIIFTSGSTGKPKGVCISYINLNSFIAWCHKEFINSDYLITFAATSCSFDLSIFEIIFSLYSGKPFRLLSSMHDIVKFLPRHSKVLINTVPSVIKLLIEQKCELANISVINLAGEKVDQNILIDLLKLRCEIRNLYGPSEDTTYSTYYRIREGINLDLDIPIGKPIDNTQCYIMDKEGNLLPHGLIGELYISGSGLSIHGYYNRDDLNKDKFTVSKYNSCQRLYKTGDLVFYDSNNDLHYVGRIDKQIKLNGLRIELGEIENTIYRIFSEMVLTNVVITINQSNKTQLICFIVWSKPEYTDNVDISLELGKYLPSYMLPNRFISLKEIPLTINGKIDQSKLVELAYLSDNTTIEDEFLSNAENYVSSVWKDVLGHSRFNLNTSFFEAGGNSLALIKVFHEITKTYGNAISPDKLIKNLSIKEMSNLIPANKNKANDIVKLNSRILLTLSEFRIYMASQKVGISKSYNIILGVKSERRLDENYSNIAVKQIISKNPNIRVKVVNKNKLLYKEVVRFNIDVNYIEFTSENLNLDEAISSYIEREREREFNFNTGPLFKIRLIRFNDFDLLLFNFHHLIADARTMQIFIQNFFTLYNNASECLPAHFTISDSLNENAQALEDEINLATNDLTILNESVNFNVVNINDNYLNICNSRLMKGVMSKISDLAKKNNITNFIILISIFSAFIHYLNGQRNFTLMLPIDSRIDKDEDSLGCFINLLPLRIEINSKIKLLSELIQKITDQILSLQINSIELSQLDYIRSLQKVNYELVNSNVIVDMLHDTYYKSANVNAEINLIEVHPKYSKQDLILYIKERGTSVEITFEASSKIFSNDDIDFYLDKLQLGIEKVISEGIECDLEYIFQDSKQPELYIL